MLLFKKGERNARRAEDEKRHQVSKGAERKRGADAKLRNSREPRHSFRNLIGMTRNKVDKLGKGRGEGGRKAQITLRPHDLTDLPPINRKSSKNAVRSRRVYPAPYAKPSHGKKRYKELKKKGAQREKEKKSQTEGKNSLKDNNASSPLTNFFVCSRPHADHFNVLFSSGSNTKHANTVAPTSLSKGRRNTGDVILTRRDMVR
jgi:hypothetical protein